MFTRSRTKDKGKGRSTETSPLLPSGSSSSSSSPDPSSSTNDRARFIDPSSLDDAAAPPPPRGLKPHLLTILYIFLTFLIVFILFVALVASSLASEASGRNQEQLAQAVVWRGPEEVRVLNVTEKDGVWVELKAWVGVDTDVALGFEEEGAGGWWEGVKKWTGRKGVDTISVASIHFPSPLALFASPPLSSSSNDEQPLFSLLPSPSTILLPLTSSLHSGTPPIFPPNPNPKHQDIPPWLTPLTLQFQVTVLAPPEDLLEFAKRSWAGQKVGVKVVMEKIEISGVGKWLGRFKGEREGVEMDLVVPIPRIPSLPYPPPTSLTDLVHLESYKVRRSRPTSDGSPPQLLLEAHASAPNVLLGMTGEFPFEVEFEVGVAVPHDDDAEEGLVVGGGGGEKKMSSSRIAIVKSHPISFNPSAPNITVSVSGYIVPPSFNSSTSSNTLLSLDLSNSTICSSNSTTQSPLAAFIQSYLSSHPLPVILNHLPPSSNLSDPPTNPSEPLPKQISSLISAFTPLAFPIPPPNPPIKLIRSVTIEGMKIAGTQDGKEILASGTVVAEVEVPGSLVGEGGVGVEVRWVRPDVFIYNGPVPPLTSPTLPFARLQPPSSLPATTLPHPSGNPLLLVVLADFKDLPLEILRPNELSNFVGKILMKGGAMAGVKGKADVRVWVEGLTKGGGGGGDGEEGEEGDDGLLGVKGVGVEGEVWVGRGR